MSVPRGWSEDFIDMLRALLVAHAEFVVVGAHALAVHGVPRATGDLDIHVRPSSENARRVVAALRDFGAPLVTHGVDEVDFERPGTVYQIGVPPHRIDLLTRISGVAFDDAWDSRVVVDIGDLKVPFIGREPLLRNKEAAGRDKDLVDAKLLRRQGS